jgi:hypothetical protein
MADAIRGDDMEFETPRDSAPFEILKVPLAPGDTLVVKLKGILSDERAKPIQDGLAKMVTEGVNILTMDDSVVGLAVLTNPDAP